MCARRSYDLTASCKAFPSYQGRAAETASSIAGFLIERFSVLLCSLHETAFQKSHPESRGFNTLIAPGMELVRVTSMGRGQARVSHPQVHVCP